MSEQMLDRGRAYGVVRYRVTGEAIAVNNCHCTLCERQIESTSVVNAFYESDRISLFFDNMSDQGVKSGTSQLHRIRRCATSDAASLSRYARFGSLGVELRAPDQLGRVKSDAVVFTASCIAWVILPEANLAFEGGYGAADILPVDGLARFRALEAQRVEMEDVAA